MSYILDALRRANSERERGTVPTLTADPGPADRDQDDESDDASLRSRNTVWIAAAAGAVLVAAVAIGLWPAKETAPQVLAAQQSSPPPIQKPSLPPIAPGAQAQDLTPPAAAATVPLSVPPLVDPSRPPVAAPAQPSAAPSKPAVMPEPRVPTKAELPEDIRKQLPALATNGAMYSDTPANRMVIINGQVLHEGDKLTPDLLLEQIMLKGAVLVFKGQRFTISY